MGQVKEKWTKEGECGLSLPDDKFVCKQCCFDDEYIQAMISDESQSNLACSYCKQFGAVHFDEVMLWVMENVMQEWSNCPRECGAGYDSETKDYLYPNMIKDAETVMCEVGLRTDNSVFWKDAEQAMDAEWCLKGVLEISFSESISHGWDTFCDKVKQMSWKELPQEWPPNDIVGESGFQDVCTLVLNHAHIRNFKGKTLYRARSGWHKTESALLAPPPEKALAGRMSPAGIPMLYCAMDGTTAAYEIGDKLGEAFSVAAFRVTADIPILDLSDVPPPPSFFGPDREYRESIKSIERFADDIAQPVGQGDSDNVDYIPTQIFAGHLAKAERTDASSTIGGVIYNSAQNQKKEGKCCVIFPRFAGGGVNGNLRLEKVAHFSFKDGKLCKQKNSDE